MSKMVGDYYFDAEQGRYFKLRPGERPPPPEQAKPPAKKRKKARKQRKRHVAPYKCGALLDDGRNSRPSMAYLLHARDIGLCGGRFSSLATVALHRHSKRWPMYKAPEQVPPEASSARLDGLGRPHLACSSSGCVVLGHGSFLGVTRPLPSDGSDVRWIATSRSPLATVAAVAFAHQNLLAACSNRATGTGVVVDVKQVHEASDFSVKSVLTKSLDHTTAHAAAWHPRDAALAVAVTKAVRYVEVADNRDPGSSKTKGDAMALAYTTDGVLLAGMRSGAVCTLDRRTRRSSMVWQAEKMVTSIKCLESDSNLAVTKDCKQRAVLWDRRVSSPVVEFASPPVPSNPLTWSTVAVSEGNDIAYGSYAGYMAAWKLSSGKLLSHVTMDKATAVDSMAYMPSHTRHRRRTPAALCLAVLAGEPRVQYHTIVG